MIQGTMNCRRCGDWRMRGARFRRCRPCLQIYIERAILAGLVAIVAVLGGWHLVAR